MRKLLMLVALTGACGPPSNNPGAPLLPEDIGTDPPADSTGVGDNDDPPRFVSRYPRLAGFVGNWEDYTPAEHDTLARFDVLAVAASPPDVSEIHAMNPEAALYYLVMPQLLPSRSWGLHWRWLDTVRTYAETNDWILRHDNGTEATARDWGGWRWGDFTTLCPPGVHFDAVNPQLDSRGLTFAEWLATRFIPWFRDNKMSGYDGFWWEIVAQKVNTYWWHTEVPYSDGSYVDWNRNGTPDVTEDGVLERFAAEWDSVTTWWIEEVRAQIGDFPIIAGGDSYTPSLEYFDGFKNEDFLNRNRWGQPFWTWWDEFYSTASARPRRGYVYQRDHARAGWSLAINQGYWNDGPQQGHDDPDRLRKFIRFSLGTTLLGDGLFCFYDLVHRSANGDEPRNLWFEEYYDLELGSDAYPFERTVVNRDTLYVRRFHDGTGRITGQVTVNPNSIELNGIPAEDARIEVLHDGSN